MNPLDALTRLIDTLTATHTPRRTTGRTRSQGAKRDTSQAKRSDSHTFTVAAPLCTPIRNVWTELHAVGIRGDFVLMPRFTTNQKAKLTVSGEQAEYASLLLWKLAATWPEGLDIKNDPHAKKSRDAVIRNGTKLPKPWKDNGKAWRQKGCKSG